MHPFTWKSQKFFQKSPLLTQKTYLLSNRAPRTQERLAAGSQGRSQPMRNCWNLSLQFTLHSPELHSLHCA